MKKSFPINTETACRLKWAWSTLYLTDGATASCHRASRSYLDTDNFLNFHNTPLKLEARQQMLDGKWPSGGCEYCQQIEHNNGYSDRNFQNTIPDIYPPELDDDNSLIDVDPVILEIFFKNTCNLKCLYCTEKLSSSILQENLKFGGKLLDLNRDTLFENKYEEFSPLLWQWMEQNFDKLKRLHILGGEPLIQPDFDKLMEFIDSHPNPELELNVVTNLIVKPRTLKNQIEKLDKLYREKKIKRIDILCSVDSWGAEQEYVRYGFSSEIFEKNFNYLLQFESIRLGLLSTVNSLSIMSMPLLAKKFNHWSNSKEIFWYMHFVLPLNSHILSPSAFRYSMWKSSFEQVYEYLIGETFDMDNTRKTLQGIMNTLESSTGDITMQHRLVEYLNGIDFRRNLNWKNTFPWLKTEIENVV